ncbi:type III secretion system translocon subunit SctE [Rouxiella sp. T17]|uniref:type III secretion system translocon subunit SctE n=1 Tax=Rouxiella sp. T17 TaxID=3085684 RepID=UPI002FC98353
MSEHLITRRNVQALNTEFFSTIETSNHEVGKRQFKSSSLSSLLKLDSQNILPEDKTACFGAPELAHPASYSQGTQPKAKGLTALVGQLMQILSQGNTDKLNNRITQLSALSQSKASNAKQILADYSSALAASEQALLNAKIDVNAHEQATSTLKQSELDLVSAQEKLASVKPDDPKYDIYLKDLNRAQSVNSTAKLAVESTKVKATSSTNIAFEKSLIADKHWEKVKAASSTNPSLGNVGNEQLLTGLAAVTLLLGQLSNLIGESADAKLKSNAELSQKLQEARQLEMQVKAKEQAEAIRKAEQLNKVMGCVGKILGGVIAAVSIVGAIFTGGASLALAAVGIALMVADPIVEAVTGKSITSRIMAPILEHVFQPMMKVIGDLINSALKKLGVKDDISEIITVVVSAIVAVAIIIVASIAAKTAGKALIKKMMPMIEKMMTKIMTKAIPQAMKNGSKMLSKNVTKAISKMRNSLGLKGDNESYKNLSTHLEKAITVGFMSKTVVDGANSIQSGLATKEISDKESQIVVAMADIKAISKFLQIAVEIFISDMKASLEAFEQVSSLNIERNNSNLFILNPRQV